MYLTYLARHQQPIEVEVGPLFGCLLSLAIDKTNAVMQ